MTGDRDTAIGKVAQPANHTPLRRTAALDAFAPWGGGIRIGDDERARVCSLLAEHFAAGRLDQTEFETRLDAATKAVRQTELAVLLADLPTETESVAPAATRDSVDSGTRPVGLGHILVAIGAPSVVVGGVLLVLIAGFGALHVLGLPGSMALMMAFVAVCGAILGGTAVATVVHLQRVSRGTNFGNQ